MSLFDFWGKDPRELFLNFFPEGATWTVVSWNFDLKDPSHRMVRLEIVKGEAEIIEWFKEKLEEVRFFKAGHLVRKRRVPPQNTEYKELMNLSVHATLKEALESHHAFLLTPVSGATTLDYQNEDKALKWIQASFGTLTRALDQLITRPELILTAAVFSGEEPETKRQVLRVLAFNLDIFFYFQADFSLQILVFDDKDGGSGSAQNPTFQQIIKVTKPQLYDEIVKLVHRIATVGEIR
jgi:hypothetical protein